MSMSVISVRQINTYIKSLLEGDSRLAFVRIRGEISNLKNHFSSGHLYFTLKDSESTIRCVMFKNNALKLKFSPNDSLNVICTGRVSVFEKDGSYQLYVEDIVIDGDGELSAALERIKEKLQKEGLFDQTKKRNIPKYPRKIAVITSESGAAIKDILDVLNRRYPICDIVFIPSIVQGVEAPNSLCNALEFAYNLKDLDLIIIGRGGGSAEDLWCFNDETLARKIFTSPFPIISAVGHETDFTICDFVADLRAPTPSAAAELAVPDCKELIRSILFHKRKIYNSLASKLTLKLALLEKIKNERIFKYPKEYFINKQKSEIDMISKKLKSCMERILFKNDKSFEITVSKLDAMSPLKILGRGYCVATNNNTILKSVKSINENDSIVLRFSDGSVDCKVKKVVENNA